tara:strand:+ start:10993 stop:11214 length:222 start_codon:yes stop_codon:yes gene_type:complete
MMLVCIALDGHLELWFKKSLRKGISNEFIDTWVFDREEIPDSLFGINKQRYYIGSLNIEDGPEFWGREVLGEL